ncbi:MAG: hypothetical protein AAGK93_00070 [Pseudomonadota bacterium]
MAKPLPVLATQRGYYGGEIKEPNEEFEISVYKEFSKIWMLPIGWKVEDGKIKRFKVKEEVIAETNDGGDDDDTDKTENKSEPAVDYSKMTAFQGVKPSYGPDEAPVTIDQAKERALQEFGHSVDKWNSELNSDDRKTRLMKAVSDLVNEQQAKKAAE